ncbi:MAG: NAD(P)/FAD-dependent oxidoreductase [Verrucomicrobiales bacterium]|nr:NAD(P)/FAD-dependent oxidoreductase [Verrucomicrobiales bacterium]
MKLEYDFLVIGGGSAGYAAARTAHELGMKTAVVDGADELGGLCILRGCMPSKTLIESADRARAMRRAEEFGLRAGRVETHPSEIIARKRQLIGEFAEYRQEQLADGRFDLIRGSAAFSGKNSVTATMKDGTIREITFRSVLIATGSRVNRIPIEGLEETGYWISDDVLNAESVPESIIVLGGGAIALEMACYLEGIGRKVTVIQRSGQLLSGSDPDLAKALEEAMQSRDGLEIYTGTSLKRIYRDETTGKKAVIFERGGEEITVIADEILQALGREPNTQGLNLETAGVELTEQGPHIDCNFFQETSAGHIYAAGDVCGPHEIVHIAIEQGELAAHNAAVSLGFTKAPKKEINYRLKLLGIFTDPPVAMVGMSEAEAKAAGREFATATYPFDDHGKSMVKGELHGFVKMMADTKTGEILGAAVVGPEAVEIIHELVVAMHFRSTTHEFLKIPHYHPTLSEIWSYPAEDLLISE